MREAVVAKFPFLTSDKMMGSIGWWGGSPCVPGSGSAMKGPITLNLRGHLFICSLLTVGLCVRWRTA
jgi:hypothetical protein